jgi:ubiquitin thioesterase protein OTUB1
MAHTSKANQEPTDADIIAFETCVRSEALGDLPFVGVYESGFMALIDQYQDNESFLRQVDYLEHHFIGWRSCLGDGNCFFRAFLCQYLDQLGQAFLNNRELFQEHQEIHDSVRAWFTMAGFDNLVLEDFIQAYDDLIKILMNNNLSREKQHETILKHLNHTEISNSMVVYLRMIASAYLRLNTDQYEPFLAGGDNMISYCSNQVEAFGKESDDLCIIALANALRVQVNVVAIDASHQDPQTYSFGVEQASKSKLDIQIDLLYRPGHYDLLYTRSDNQ